MKQITLLLCSFFLFGNITAQSDCRSCECLLEKADQLATKVTQMELAIKKYNAVKTCDPSLTEKVDKKIIDVFQKIIDVFQKIIKLKNQSDSNEKEAKRQSQIAKENAENAQKQTQTALANDLAYKAQNLLKEGDRTKAFQLAAFAHRFIDATNHEADKAIHDAYYYNDHPDRQKDSTQQIGWYRSYTGHSSSVYAANFSPDGDYVISASDDKTLKLWKIKSEDIINSLPKMTVFLPSDIQQYNLFEMLMQTNQWDNFLVTADSKQVWLFGQYLQQEVETNNNPDTYNPQLTKAIQCYQITAKAYPYYNLYVTECYLEWAAKLSKGEYWEEAAKKVALAAEVAPADLEEVVAEMRKKVAAKEQ